MTCLWFVWPWLPVIALQLLCYVYESIELAAAGTCKTLKSIQQRVYFSNLAQQVMVLQ